jgi:hypothetical protein
MNVVNIIGVFLTGIVLFVLLLQVIDSGTPCSIFSSSGICSSPTEN